MHIEKNICDSILGTLLNIVGKMKDIDKSRLDLKDLNIRKELHLQQHVNIYIKPPQCYASNISRCVSINEGKILGLKSHDCHVLLQRLLPIGIHAFFAQGCVHCLGRVV